jgi:hypothetical protein
MELRLAYRRAAEGRMDYQGVYNPCVDYPGGWRGQNVVAWRSDRSNTLKVPSDLQ